MNCIMFFLWIFYLHFYFSHADAIFLRTAKARGLIYRELPVSWYDVPCKMR
jgi:hypothetical protein